MGINANILAWFEELAAAGAFKGARTLLELGPPDCFVSIDQFAAIAARRLGKMDAQACVSAASDQEIPFSARRAAFYRPLGNVGYKSVDTYDTRADFILDLNTATAPLETFDVVVDCGTTEHVFNAGNVFAFTHNALAIGGLSVKVLPTFGDNRHGFYNIHPTAYFDVARADVYEMVDFRYVANMSALPRDAGAPTLLPPAAFQTGLTSFAGCAGLQASITRRFAESIAQSERESRIDQAHATVDYCFVAMRKLRPGAFHFPGQGVYLAAFAQ